MKIKQELETKYSDFTIERNEEKFEVDFKNFKREFNTDEKCYKTIKSEPLEINIKGNPISTNNRNGSTIWNYSGYKIERDIKKEDVKDNWDVKHGIKSECKAVLSKLKIEIKTEDCNKVDHYLDDNEQPVNNEFFTPERNSNKNEMNIQIEEEEQNQEYDIQHSSKKRNCYKYKYNIKTKKYFPSIRKCNRIYDKIKRKYFRIKFASRSKQEFTCNLCEETFTNKKILETHLLCHIGKKPFRCTTCNKKFLWQFSLRKHVKEHKTGNKNEIFLRNLCLRPSGNRVYSFPRNGKVHACKICGKEFKSKKLLLHHGTVHSEERPFKCDICNKSFKRKETLKHHHETHNDKLNYSCQVCNKRFKTKDYLRVHKVVHSDEFNYTCQVCNKSFKQSRVLNKHINTHSDEHKYFCNICNKYLKEKDSLRRHKLRHSQKSNIKRENLYCDICGKRVPYGKGRLEIHKRIHKVYACKICGKEFKSKKLLLHHGAMHSEERPFKCDICNKSYKWKDSLKRHHATHSDERPFKCDICDKGFKLRRLLKKHKKTHSDERNYTCQVCNKSYKQSFYLKQHILTHTDERKYSCHICNKYFKTKVILKRHEEIHNDRKKYVCDICKKCYTYKTTLARHCLTKHENMYLCNVCNKPFKTKNALEEHSKVHI